MRRANRMRGKVIGIGFVATYHIALANGQRIKAR